MSGVTHTRKEREVINLGWAYLVEACSAAGGWDTRPRLDRALASERKWRSSPAAAKALLCEGFLTGMNNPTLAEVATLSDGILLVAAMGADLMARDRMPEGAVAKIRAAREAHSAAVKRALEAV